MSNIIQNKVEKLAERLICFLKLLSNLFFIAIALVMGADVIGRYLFSKPLFGAIEIIEILMALLIFSSIPIATYKCDHIKIALLENVLSEKIRLFINYFNHILFMVGLYLISERLWELTHRFSSRNSHTEFLEIPFSYLGYAGIFSCYITMFLILLLLIQNKNTETFVVEGK